LRKRRKLIQDPRVIELWSSDLIVPVARSISSYWLTLLCLNQNKSVWSFIAVLVECIGTELVFGGPEGVAAVLDI
jgi:hypothetical protein